MFVRSTPSFVGYPDSIASLEKRQIGGIDQWLLIRGKQKKLPILLFLHGGPGTAQIGIAPSIQKELEQHFLVVNWDQLGAGLSYSKDPSLASTMTIDQYIADLLEVTQQLLAQFGQEKLYLVGHSWGTILGTLFAARYPELLHAYIGTGQIGCMIEGEQASYAYTVQKATETNNHKALQQLHKVADLPIGSMKRLGVQRKWLARFGGVTHSINLYPWMLKRFVLSRTYTLTDWSKFAGGAALSLRTVWSEVMTVNLFQSVPELKVPVWFLTGRYDYNTPFEVAERYFQALRAPMKNWVWFENSAHAVPFEEHALFTKQLIWIKREINTISLDETMIS